MVKSHTPVNMACESSWSSKTTAKQQRNRIKEKAQLVMHVTRKDHRESSPARRWKYIIIETMKNVKTHSVMGERGKTMSRWRRLKCSYTVRLTRGTSSFLYTSMMLSVSLISFGSFLQDIISCDESLFQFCFRTRAINLLWTTWYQKNLADFLFFPILLSHWNSQTNNLFILTV